MVRQQPREAHRLARRPRAARARATTRTKKPVALFDWDNTIIKNDFGDAVTFHAIAHDKVRQPPNQDWKATSKFMTDDAATALTTACGTTVRGWSATDDQHQPRVR